jgi:hypothetical protein
MPTIGSHPIVQAVKAVSVHLLGIHRVLVVGLGLRGGMDDARGRGRSGLKHRDGTGLLWVGLNKSSHAGS